MNPLRLPFRQFGCKGLSHFDFFACRKLVDLCCKPGSDYEQFNLYQTKRQCLPGMEIGPSGLSGVVLLYRLGRCVRITEVKHPSMPPEIFPQWPLLTLRALYRITQQVATCRCRPYIRGRHSHFCRESRFPQRAFRPSDQPCRLQSLPSESRRDCKSQVLRRSFRR